MVDRLEQYAHLPSLSGRVMKAGAGMLTVAALLPAAAGGRSVSPPARTAEAPTCSMRPAATSRAARWMTHLVRSERAVHYDANMAVVCNDQETVIPLERDAKGSRQWFRLVGHGATVKAVEILHPTQLVTEQWTTSDGTTEPVVSDHGVVNLNTVDGTPSVRLRLQGGEHEYRAIAQTSTVG